MQCNADEMWLNAIYVNALIFSQIDLKIKKKSMHMGTDGTTRQAQKFM